MPSQNAEIGVFIIVTTGLILLLIGFIILILFLYKRKQMNFYKHLESLKNDYDKNLLAAVLEIQEETLRHISREMHDNIGLSLSVAKMSLLTIDWDNIAHAPHKVNDSVQQITHSIESLRRLSHTLNPEYIAENGLLKAIDQQMDQINRLEMHQTAVEMSGNYVSMEAQKEVVVFRIVQEALHNSIKHAKATRLHIKMQYAPAHLCIQVCDNGREWKKEEGAPGNGSGLKNMQKRALLLNGECRIEHQPEQGTTVTLTIPY